MSVQPVILRAGLMVAAALALVACQTPVPRSPPPPSREPAPQVPPPATSPQPAPQTTPDAPGSARPARPPSRSFRLGPATSALVAQGRAQSKAGQHAAAAATVERAVRIEPANPLVWLELAKVRQAEGRHDQGQSLAEKALSMAAGDASVQASAWRLIAATQRARGRMLQARESERRANALSPH